MVYALVWMLGIALASEVDAHVDPIIGPGDTVYISVVGQDFGQNDFEVGATGEISMPFIGKVKLGGMTAFEAEDAFKAVLVDGFLVNPQVTVRVKDYRSQRIDVIGAVNKPNVYPLDGPTTVRSLLAKAGGVAMERASGAVFVMRNGDTTEIPVSALEGPAGDFMVQGGDVVDVDMSRAIYLAGEVAKPGPVGYSPGLTASQALLRAGGDTRYSRLSGTYIVRREERIYVNLKKVLKGKEADILLQPDDRIIVPISAL
jgi:polysaccharide export outer membrane protein